MKYRIRIKEVCVENLKNVKYGKIDLRESKDNHVSMLGLYGQNGSGKTTLIDALDILKFYLMGTEIKQDYANMITQGKEYSRLSYVFELNDDEKTYENQYSVNLSFSFRKKDIKIESNDIQDKYKGKETILEVFNEVISFAYKSKEENIRENTIIDTSDSNTFKPESKYKEIFGNDKEIKEKVIIDKNHTNKSSKSYIFSDEFITLFNSKCENNHYKFLINTLNSYGKSNLNVLYTASVDKVDNQLMPMYLYNISDKKIMSGVLAIDLIRPSTAPEAIYKNVKNAFDQINIVLKQLIPNMQLKINELGKETNKNMIPCIIFELISERDGFSIPLRFESAGIRKIISTLSLLITVYNNPDMTVAIDEIDSGIFEYLLGEIMNIFSDGAKGQLIYTSHNLRALETINKDFTAFTTTDENNRYIHFKGIKANNNLRDYYFTDIVFGEQEVETYQKTNKYEIALALHNAGVIDG